MGARVRRSGLALKRVLLALGAVLLVSGSAVLGHEGATGIVKERMDDMKAIGGSLKRIGDRIRSKRDLAAVAADAEKIAAAAARMPSLFPKGSHDGHTEATPAVWQKWPDFVASSQSLKEASVALAAAARSGDAAKVSEQLRLVSRSCGSCHDTFRARQ